MHKVKGLRFEEGINITGMKGIVIVNIQRNIMADKSDCSNSEGHPFRQLRTKLYVPLLTAILKEIIDNHHGFHHRMSANYVLQLTNNRYVRFQVLTAASTKFRDFWNVSPCSHVEVKESSPATRHGGAWGWGEV
jgi:hypothetical protein